ncbi:hypothetical protein QJ856_gp0717 [Tupanvirus deep ocean]|uniref:Uncharacterized protein n=2 Tax=Tupanvirus TaxID=2094720 RepID=A0AC62A8D2_9VIRU|nr:hypothetical protein QJ856_gp0717 [Tupanvirus deep ocean]QKU34034.1 hypothetical protein [Tupanvirus deep ocean]
MSSTCPNCRIYYKNLSYDFCCLSCRDSGGSTHGRGCGQSIVHTTTLSNICPKCNTYEKYPGKDFCCNTCRQSFGSNHGIGCLRTTKHSSSGLCIGCKTHNKYPGYDHCCKSCATTRGGSHGSGCTSASKSSSSPTNLPLEPLTNLRTGGFLYGPKTICFYNSSCKYYEFTNFYAVAIHIDGIWWPTTEHYFQAQKFSPNYPLIVNEIATAVQPRDAFDISRKYASYVRSDWNNGYKDSVMLKALEAKFTQHTNLRKLLISTGDYELVEHTINDKYWGDNGDGTGQNQLGKLLMQVRDKINKGLI